MTTTPDPAQIVDAVLRRRRFNLIWLVPIVAGGISLYLAVNFLSDRGPLITLSFLTADGITAQQTEVKHKAVSLGMVENVHLSADLKRAVVHVRMKREALPFLTDHAHFWVVRPRLTPGNISGLETLVSGAYIEVDPGEPGGAAAREFIGLEEPPGVRSDEPGATFWLSAPRLGSIGPGTPLFYRDVTVGEVLRYDIGNGIAPVRIHVFVKAPFDKYVHDATHFWNASGVSLSLGAQGIHLQFESLQALLAGGIAFETPRAMAGSPPSAAEQVFKLFDSEADADAAGEEDNIPLVAYFDSSVAGLARGSVVEVFGLQVGSVTDVRLTLIPGGTGMHARVAFDLQPGRVFADAQVRSAAAPAAAVAALVRQGMRAVLESSNLITGQQAISLQYIPGSVAPLEHEGNVLVVPSQGGGLDNITASISDIAGKLDKIPFDEIGRDLASTLKSVDRTVSGPDMQNALRQLSETLTDISHLARHADEGLAPALKRLPQLSADLQQAVARANAMLGAGGIGSNSDLQRSLGRLLDQVNDAARSIRLLADFLDRHPEALIRGRAATAGEP